MTTADLASIVLPGLIGFAAGSLLMIWQWWQAEKGRPYPLALIASLQATIDDQAREVERLTGEKHARDQKLHAVKEIVGG